MWLVADGGTSRRTQQLRSAQATEEPQPEAEFHGAEA